MAKEKPNASGYKPGNMGEDLDKARDELEEHIYADHYNLSHSFFKKNEEELEKIKKDVSNIAANHFNYKGDKNSMINPLDEFKNIVLSTIDRRKEESKRMFDDNSVTSSGIRSIAADDSNVNLENNIIQSFGRLMGDSYILIREYRNVAKLVPELKKVFRMIVRDTINTNEVTKRSLVELYKERNEKRRTCNENELAAVNILLEKFVVDKYKLEEKQNYWFYEAFSAGSKPVAVFSYRDVIEQAINAEKEKRNKFSTKYSSEELDELNNLSFDGMSREELSSCLDYLKDNISDSKVLGDIVYTPKIKNSVTSKFYKQSEEDDEETIARRSEEADRAYDDIISDDLINKIYENGMETLYVTKKVVEDKIESCKNMYSEEAIEESTALQDSLKAINNTISKIETGTYEGEEKKKELDENSDEVAKIKKKIRDNLKFLVDDIDQNIEVVKDGFTAFTLNKNYVNREKRYRKYYEKTGEKPKNFNENEEYTDGERNKVIEELDPSAEMFNNNSLLLEFEPEFVIPVTVGSEHIGYYVYEFEAMYGSEELSKKRTGSFTELIKNTGYGADSNVVSVMSGISVAPNDPSNSSVFSPVGLASNPAASLMGFDQTGTGSEERIDIMKQIVLKTLSKRLDDPELMENKQFKDTIMGLIREGYIVDKRIQFTFIPANKMVYFASNLDDRGVAHSILEGTLLIWYMYLSSIISSLMIKLTKSADKEKLEINMGLSGQIGMTLSEIQKNLSTRSIHMRSFFDNVGSVLKNSSVYQRITIPVFDGEKLYEINPLEKINDYSIDDEYTDKLKMSGISVTGAPPSIFNALSEAEFSRSIVVTSLEYRDYTIERQTPLSKQMEKLIRILAENEKIPIPSLGLNDNDLESFDPIEFMQSVKRTDDTKYINVRNIEHSYKPPMHLNMTNVSETFSNVEPVIDAYIKYCYGEEIEDTITKQKVARAKKELMKMFANNIDLDYIENVVQKLEEDVGNDILEKTKDTIISQNLDKLKEGGDSSF